MTLPNGHSRESLDARTNGVALSSLPQPVASSSKLPGNPQLGPEPFFTYPTPIPEQIEEELPPIDEDENIPLGILLDRLVRKNYGELRGLTEQK